MREQRLELHGHAVSYRAAGREGPVILLIHGITSSSRTWDEVIPLLARGHRVVAPDLLGHGRSAKPRADYSPAAHAAGVRDLMTALGHRRFTVVGHSLGGGVAMQLAYQFPERVERLVLVASGGLGREVSPLLRAASLPGAEWVLPLLGARPVRGAGAALGRLLGALGVELPPDVEEIARGVDSLGERGARAAFLNTLRSVVDPAGQRVDARDRLYLAAVLPSLIVWGERDPIIPASHGTQARELMPGSRLELFESAGHFPHRDEPERFARVLSEFVAGTGPAEIDEHGHIRELVLRRSRAPRPER
ncbi:MAG: alpha/beta fold hydrolase [Thermoleophilaceae bacterium]|nr:alpha/beta fold hydrolase [Thermoleophilaceae bacterium]